MCMHIIYFCAANGAKSDSPFETFDCILVGFSSTLRCLTMVKAVRPAPPPSLSPPFTTIASRSSSSGSSLASEYTLCGLVSVSANTEDSSSAEELAVDSSRSRSSSQWRRRRPVQWCSCRCGCCCSSAWWRSVSSRAGGVCCCRRRSRLVTVTWPAATATVSTSGATGFRSALVAPPNNQSRVVPVTDGFLFRLLVLLPPPPPPRVDGVELCRLPITAARIYRYSRCERVFLPRPGRCCTTVAGQRQWRSRTANDDDDATGYPHRTRLSRPAFSTARCFALSTWNLKNVSVLRKYGWTSHIYWQLLYAYVYNNDNLQKQFSCRKRKQLIINIFSEKYGWNRSLLFDSFRDTRARFGNPITTRTGRPYPICLNAREPDTHAHWTMNTIWIYALCAQTLNGSPSTCNSHCFILLIICCSIIFHHVIII